jgi:hypothetical protein
MRIWSSFWRKVPVISKCLLFLISIKIAMNIKLSLLFYVITLLGYSQTPIMHYESAPLSNYAIINNGIVIDQSPSGANVVWDFSNLATTIGNTTTDTYASPTPEETTIYPGTTSVITTTDNGSGQNKYFTKNSSMTITVTGATRPDLTLNYSSDNALLGTFPMSYGTATTDAVAGNISFTTSNGTFAGTIDTQVDAYGTLNIPDLGNGVYNGSVTRLKSVQNLNLSLGFISGTAVLTFYNYYDASNGNLVFRTSTVTINSPFFSDTSTVMESLLSVTLEVNNSKLSGNQLKIYPNPVTDVLNISTNSSIVMRAIEIRDISGREVLKVEGNNTSLSVSHLQSGLYIATITTQKGTLIQKFIKK